MEFPKSSCGLRKDINIYLRTGYLRLDIGVSLSWPGDGAEKPQSVEAFRSRVFPRACNWKTSPGPSCSSHPPHPTLPCTCTLVLDGAVDKTSLIYCRATVENLSRNCADSELLREKKCQYTEISPAIYKQCYYIVDHKSSEKFPKYPSLSCR